MYLDINTKKLKKNAFRVSKHRGETASRIRVPGGKCNADVLSQVAEISRKYGNGSVHLTTRQGFEIEGIALEDVDKVNQELQPIIENLEIDRIIDVGRNFCRTKQVVESSADKQEKDMATYICTIIYNVFP